MKIIGLTGQANAGKDTVADKLVSDYGFVKYSFAKPLKDMLKVLGVDCDNRETKELPHPTFKVSPRVMAQTLGTEWMRNCIDKDGWLLLAKAFVQGVRGTPVEGIVFSDVRFINEAEYVRACGTLIHVWRPDIETVTPHVSENGIPFRDCDRALMNDKVKEITFRRLDGIMVDL
jgi:deoxynucleotide monophosphate kinase-like protein